MVWYLGIGLGYWCGDWKCECCGFCGEIGGWILCSKGGVGC